MLCALQLRLPFNGEHTLPKVVVSAAMRTLPFAASFRQCDRIEFSESAVSTRKRLTACRLTASDGDQPQRAAIVCAAVT